MKKSIKKFFSAISFVLVLSCSLFAVACSSASNNISSKVTTQVVDTGNDEEINENVSSQSTENNAPVDDYDLSLLNGIYKFAKTSYNFDDKYYNNFKQLVNYFYTKDENGVYFTVQQKGFDEFAKNITFDSNNNQKAFLFENGEVYGLTYNENNFYSSNNEDNFTLTSNGNNISVSRKDLKIEVDDLTINLYYEFTYKSEGYTYYTPLYVKTTLVKQDNTSNLFTGQKLNYLNHTVSLVQAFGDKTDYNLVLSEAFNIENSENTIYKLNELLGTYNYKFLDDENVLVYNDNSFIVLVNTNNTVVYNDLSIDILTKTTSSSQTTVNFNIKLSETAILIFSFNF